ncbi:coiled-coil domain-containing protein 174-like [Gigantopelta aegis]|uniref:coiled-coil domain-containing protein 174-like n=1 Tax=Gigantopelta aegis TaxID=1735272 RepID=UPI001B88B089|nr:coiled-coil domain-containing protein 174-like [Gigantopelta aegis]
MDERKTGSMNVSSIVDLKAELFRKQEELKRQKSVSNDGRYIKGKTTNTTKTNIWSKKNAGVLERAQQDLEQKEEDENIFDKSKKSLEAKAQLYDKICKSSDIPEEDGSGTYLVDFQKKVIDNIVEKRNKDKMESVQKIQHELPMEEECVPPEEQWVDYVDSLGRSRRCMKKDVLELQQRDKEFNSKLSNKTSSDPESTSDKTETPTLMSSDMQRELLRQKWEKEEEEARNQAIHYSNVRYDEIRSHGVGYYQFSRSEETRQKEMEILDKLREQTLDERLRRERLKEKRKALLSARLAKVKQRRTMKGGLMGLEGGEGDEKTGDEIGPRHEEMLGQTEVKEKQVVEPLTRDDSWRKDFPVREWDKGKEQLPIFSAEKYSQDRKDERLDEFAPPSFYKDEPIVKQSFKNLSSKAKESSYKPTIPQKVKNESLLKTERLVTPSVDVSHIPLPPNVSKIPTRDKEFTASSEADLQTYGQRLTESQQIPVAYHVQNISSSSYNTSVSQHTPNKYHMQDSSSNYNLFVPQQISGSLHMPDSSSAYNPCALQQTSGLYHMPDSSSNYNTDATQQMSGMYPLPDSSSDYNTRVSSDRMPGGCFVPGYIPNKGYRWSASASSSASSTSNTQTANSNIAGSTTIQANYGHSASSTGPVPSGSAVSTSGLHTVNPNIAGSTTIQANYGHSASSTGPVPDGSTVSTSGLQLKTEHGPRLPKLSIVDSRFIQNELESEPIGGEFLPSTEMEAVAYEPGSYTEALNQCASENQYTAAPGRSNYSGGAVLYTQKSSDSGTEHTADEAVDKFLKDIRNETV